MKIVVTYEKADVLRLVAQDVKAQGIRVKAGTSLEYKGPLQVKFEVDTDDDASLPAVKQPIPEASAVSRVPTAPAPSKEEPVDMAGILSASQHLAKTTKGIYETKDGPPRQLGPNESYEYPKE